MSLAQQKRIDALIKDYPVGTMMQKTKGSQWRGKVVGYYSTKNTVEGLAIESMYEQGSVQIYPVNALERL